MMMMMMMMMMLARPSLAQGGQPSPIIGIMAQPSGSTQQYVAASYVKFVEMAGGRAMPLSYFSANDTTWLDQINGVLFPGGASDPPPIAQFVVEYAKRKYDEDGDYFPVWGTCLGFEWLAEVCGGFLTNFQAENISLPLIFTEKARTSYLFKNANVRQKLAAEPLTANFHTQGVPPTEYAPGSPLGELFDVLSTNFDSNGLEFVSTVEGKRYPLFGVQWHPEKNTFETGLSPDGTFYNHIPHSSDASAVTFEFAQNLVNAARRSNHKFNDPTTEINALFNNCPASGAKYPEFVQSYFFDKYWDGSTLPCAPTTKDDLIPDDLEPTHFW
mmetsp:Transcript_28397/g.91546  ORF Transcript_28397/g.91546 Transcript_28397/m.91546 type:complete len:328 (-) Transcript_28397:250-1233(-)